MTADELQRLRDWALRVDLQEMAALVDEVRLLRAAIEQQAAWLREITTERDALKLRVAELEEAERLRDEALSGHWLAKSSEERLDELKAQIAILEQRA